MRHTLTNQAIAKKTGYWTAAILSGETFTGRVTLSKSTGVETLKVVYEPSGLIIRVPVAAIRQQPGRPSFDELEAFALRAIRATELVGARATERAAARLDATGDPTFLREDADFGPPEIRAANIMRPDRDHARR